MCFLILCCSHVSIVDQNHSKVVLKCVPPPSWKCFLAVVFFALLMQFCMIFSLKKLLCNKKTLPCFLAVQLSIRMFWILRISIGLAFSVFPLFCFVSRNESGFSHFKILRKCGYLKKSHQFYKGTRKRLHQHFKKDISILNIADYVCAKKSIHFF